MKSKIVLKYPEIPVSTIFNVLTSQKSFRRILSLKLKLLNRRSLIFSTQKGKNKTLILQSVLVAMKLYLPEEEKTTVDTPQMLFKPKEVFY